MKTQRRKKMAVGKRYASNAKTCYPTYALTDEKYLNEKEHAQLLQNLKLLDDAPKQRRNVTLIYTALLTGARANEILNLRPKDLLDNNRVHIRGLKGSNDRDIPVPEWLFKRLETESKRGYDFIFNINYQRFWEIWHQINPTTKKLHALRHTFAMRLYLRTKDLFLVQRALGHVTIDCTLIYLNFAQTQESMARIVDDSFI